MFSCLLLTACATRWPTCSHNALWVNLQTMQAALRPGIVTSELGGLRELKRKGTFAELPGLQVIRSDGDHSPDLFDCFVRLPAVQ